MQINLENCIVIVRLRNTHYFILVYSTAMKEKQIHQTAAKGFGTIEMAKHYDILDRHLVKKVFLS